MIMFFFVEYNKVFCFRVCEFCKVFNFVYDSFIIVYDE